MPDDHSVTKWRLVSCHKTCLPGFRWGNHYPIDSLPATLFSHALPRPASPPLYLCRPLWRAAVLACSPSAETKLA